MAAPRFTQQQPTGQYGTQGYGRLQEPSGQQQEMNGNQYGLEPSQQQYGEEAGQGYGQDANQQQYSEQGQGEGEESPFGAQKAAARAQAHDMARIDHHPQEEQKLGEEHHPAGHHRQFPQDAHHSKLMAHFHDIAEQGLTDDHIHSLIHVGSFVLANLAKHTGMTAAHAGANKPAAGGTKQPSAIENAGVPAKPTMARK